MRSLWFQVAVALLVWVFVIVAVMLAGVGLMVAAGALGVPHA